MPVQSLRRGYVIALLLLCGIQLNSCATVCIGPLCVGGVEQLGVPLLYADPDVRIERPTQGIVPYEPGMALYSCDIVQTAGSKAVISISTMTTWSPYGITRGFSSVQPNFFWATCLRA